MLIELTKSDYEILNERFTLNKLNIKFDLIACDDTLFELGLADEPLCLIEISNENLEYIMKCKDEIL